MIVNQLVDLHFLLFVNITRNWKNRLVHTRQIIITDWLSLSESSWRVYITRVQWKHLTPERSIDLCLQTFPKLLLLLVPKVTTHSLYPECIANLKLPSDAFYRESRSGVNIAKRNIATGLFGLTKIL
jgi:hypothetical protein